MRSIKKIGRIIRKSVMTSDIYNNNILVNKYLRNTNNILKNPIKNGHVYEDRCSKYFHKNFSLFALYDGHGSLNENHILEYTHTNLLTKIANNIIKETPEKEADPQQIVRIMHKSFFDIEKECRQLFSRHRHIGCTATVVFINLSNIITAWVGDSPCYLFYRKNEKIKGIQKIIDEHNYENTQENNRVIKSGAQWIDKRVHGTIMMSRSIGDFEDKDKGGLIAVPQTRIIKRNSIHTGIFICSDGISDVINGEIFSTIPFTSSKKNENVISVLNKISLTSTSGENFIKSIVNYTNMSISNKNSLTRYRDDISCIYINL